MIIVKSPREIALMKNAGKLVAQVFETVGPMIKPGVSTYEINEAAERVIYDGGGTCPCKGYYDYPAGTCVSVNDTLIHGIPSKIILQDGDIVSLMSWRVLMGIALMPLEHSWLARAKRVLKTCRSL